MYESAKAYWDFDLFGICKSIEEGLIYIDFDAKTKAGRGSTLRNNETKFKLNINDICSIYKNSQIIV